ncbi:GntR family transcriptional regulator [Xylanimonas ulmi]|uniref:GntR family transcriptional regulator n=1 Tax=Xylanimonas ulmi TaxID=228973 RepID=UPI001F5F8849|nr:GntR family transcriptional regulator [Xylanibacterium ulmi]
MHAQLRRRVVELDLAPGSPVSVNDLAASLGVSRTPVRESLIRLADEGLVMVFPKVGTFVARIDPQQVADAQFLREAVELASLASLASQPLDDDAVAALRENVAAQYASGDRLDDFLTLGEDFHRGLLALAGHAGAWTAIAAAQAHLDRARRLSLQTTPAPALVHEHDAILRAVIAGDAEEAASLMRSHLRAVFTDIEQVRARSPQFFGSAQDAPPVRRSVTVWGDRPGS